MSGNSSAAYRWSFLLLVFGMVIAGQAQANSTTDQTSLLPIDQVISASKTNMLANFVQLSPPASPCSVITYAVCNYFLPANDYVTFTLSPSIQFNNAPCLQANLNSLTITFENAPPVPIFVWLSSGGGTNSTPPIYMTGASFTMPKPSGTLANNSWFSATTVQWTQLCVQAIYPNPPPTTFYYPGSCTIVYQ